MLRDGRIFSRGTTLIHEIYHALTGTRNRIQYLSPVTVGIRPNLLYFNRKLQGEFTASHQLFRINQQLSV